MSKDKIKAALEIALKHIETLMCTPALNQGQEYANRFNDRKLVIDAIAALAQQATVEPVQVIKEQRFAGQSDREAKEVQVSQPVAVYSLEYGHKLETENEALKVERDKLQMDCEALQTAIQNFKAAPDYPAAGWIPVSERLPEMNVPVLTSSGFGVTAHCRVDLGDGNWGWGVPQYSNLSDCRNYECDDDYAVNSWMNFPAAPKGKE